jgi:hypothetical protein
MLYPWGQRLIDASQQHQSAYLSKSFIFAWFEKEIVFGEM